MGEPRRCNADIMLHRLCQRIPEIGADRCDEHAGGVEETGWLIECVTLGKIAYWCGPQLWTGDHLEAVRFARKEDAERVWRHPSCQGIEARVTEHMWSPVKLGE